jgi:transposase-like protein
MSCRRRHVEVSPTLISNMTDAVIEEVKQCQGDRWKT